jgi:eukaryotic-like serine/threonine-protein kinase
MPLTAGTRLGRYAILSSLGAGGMGEVYCAEDTLLGRQVAVKVLRENLAQNSAALKRFQKEAQALAALSHPNILDLHDFGFDQGVSYAVSELLEGETLRARMAKSPLEWQKAVEIGAAAAEGLAAAHSKGVIHRDLKPENIFLLRKGGIKILDFGLARLQPVISEQDLTDAVTVSRGTESGIVMGTVPYMSPEQVRGQPVDARSDIFSLGCVLYEMLSAETTAAILRDDPPNIAGIPPELDRILQHCLEKDPERRLHSAHDLAFGLKELLATSSNRVEAAKVPRPTHRKMWMVAVAAAVVLAALAVIALREKFLPQSPAAEKIESLAVLPLQNLSGDPNQEYFADGMTEELIAGLARIGALRVISRTSVMQYKKTNKSLPDIAKELKVDAIVEGSVLQSGDRVRITAQLVHAATDHHLWAESYERDMTDILALQNDVAAAVAQEIRIQLTPQEQVQFTTSSKVNPAAYEAYLRGIYYKERMTEEDARLAVAMFERAIELDPKFARAYAQLSIAHSGMYHYVYDRTAERLAKAKRAVDRAFELQPGLPEGHIAMGFYHLWGYRNYDQALQEFSIAQKDIPNDAWLLMGVAAIHKRQGNVEAALQAFKRILQLDPRNATAAHELGTIYSATGEYAEAQRYFDLVISLEPDSHRGYVKKVQNHFLWTGDTKTARELSMKISFEKVRNEWLAYVEFLARNYQAALDFAALSDASNIMVSWIFPKEANFAGDCYRQMKMRDMAHRSYEAARIELEKLLKKSPENFELHGSLGLAYAGLDRKEEAIREAQTAVDLFPVTKDAFVGLWSLAMLARVYVMVGEYESALDQIEYLLSVPTYPSFVVTVPLLRIDPTWDPLRSHPRFQKILQKYSSEKR